ncbi:MAG: YraN family protein [Bacteroidetes bacterium]|nr:YraN family protein [Bacteroidota bacterium]
MAESHTLGKRGEQIAEKLLESKGFKIRERNWRTGKREIDLIAENISTVVFAEVKTRTAGFQVDPRDAVTAPKQRNLIFAAETYVKRNGIEKEIRFDIITLVADGRSFRTEHIEDAFYPTL